MIFSIHIPKTAGTSFRYALDARYGRRVAYYYGKLDPKTTEGLRVSREELAEAAASLSSRGFDVLHGHYMAVDVEPLVTSPSEIWTWLRDPVERTISQWEFYRQRPLELKPLARRVKEGRTTLAGFLETRDVADLQTRYLKGLDLSTLGFVGVSEHFELGLTLLFGEDAPTLKLRYNATERETPMTRSQRHSIARANIRDMQLYAEALRLFVGRVADANGVSIAGQTPGLVKRLIRSVR